MTTSASVTAVTAPEHGVSEEEHGGARWALGGSHTGPREANEMRRHSSLTLRLSLAGLAAALIASSAGPAAAAGCTDGVNCYCDTVSDPNLVFCEDFESRDYYENTANDFVAAGGVGGAGDRGGASRWYANWRAGTAGALFKSGDPSPRVPSACTYAFCSGTREYCSTEQGNLVDGRGADCWGPGVNSTARIDIQRADDINDEVSSTRLTGGKGVTQEIGAGNQHLALRNGPGHAGGFTGGKSLSCGGGRCTELGITLAAAYSPNSLASGIWNGPWKHEEWGESAANNTVMFGNVGAGAVTGRPYMPAMFMKPPYAESVCNAVVAGSTIRRGLFQCVGGLGIKFGPDPAYYNQTTHWPWGTWACSQGHIKGLGTSNGSFKLWHNGTLILDVDNIDFRQTLDQYYGNMGLNNFANTNDPASGGTNPSDETTYRYIDNFHVRSGPPVSCAAIGYGGGGGEPPPPPPGGEAPAAPILLDP